METKFEWTCPRCGKYILAQTDRGLKYFSEDHIYNHIRQDREAAKEKEPEIKNEQHIEKVKQTAIQKYVRRDPNILLLTRIDFGFLRTRGIKWDEQTVLDKDYNGTD